MRTWESQRGFLCAYVSGTLVASLGFQYSLLTVASPIVGQDETQPGAWCVVLSPHLISRKGLLFLACLFQDTFIAVATGASAGVNSS